MEMERTEPLSQYRQRLLESLQDLPRRQRDERPGLVQVFVNQECVGDLDCRKDHPNFSFTSRDRSIQVIELRSETGTLIGGLSVPEVGLRTTHVPWASHRIEVTVHNRLEGGSLRVTYKEAPRFWAKLRRAAGTMVPSWADGGMQPAALHGMALAQVALLLAVAFLIGDRLFERMERTDDSAKGATAVGQELVSAVQTQDAINRLEEKVNSLLTAQSTSSQALDGNQKTIISVQRALDDLTQQQKQMGTQVVSVQQMEEHQERIARQSNQDVDRMAKILMGQVQSERAQLRDELHSLSMANEHLAKHVSSMEKKNQDLLARLRSAGIEVSSKVKETSDASVMIAKEKEGLEAGGQTPQVAEVRPDLSPLKFFVSFHDGTTEESIDRWFQDLHARKGDADSGWYTVEVPQPPQQPADRFMEGLKTGKIIKAVATSRTRLPAR